jgi:hypothetical protein
VAVEAHAAQKGLALVSVRPTSFHTNLLAYDAASIRAEACFRSPLGREAWLGAHPFPRQEMAVISLPAACPENEKRL